ncbi:putative secreted protein with PEP-CTERM sorting signal [Nitrosospira sp. Nsp2]|uniref:PEP-CTERM sorting domain-containing protein n=1 Tax=Nitrosospira sp. Nsp2 TaxID=136548 RepID=UPI000D41B761|nr:PEP-CTERM sorting domain-containing protein [Nitrosospira sp. Nsp2]PTR13631.1 putative secreted protein with PEP-CTERM sorting signal [Nitrosospira sp. Nsp2]
MNKFSQGLVVALGSIGLGLSQAAQAVENLTPVTATATIDWSKLQLSVTGVTATVRTVVFSNYNTSLSSSSTSAGGNESHSVTRNDWTSTAHTNTSAGASLANGLASSEIFSGTASAVETGSVVSSSGTRSVGFSFDGPGMLTFSVPYTISLTGITSVCCYSDTAFVNGSANFYSSTNGGSSNSSSSASFSIDSYGDLSSTSRAGNLVFGIVASDAGTGSLSVGFNASAHGAVVAVPEPESYAMLLAGLGLMGAVVQRRKKMGAV